MGVDDVVEGVVGGTTWGLGVALIAGAVLLVGKGGRPVAKQAIKGYLVASERARALGFGAAARARELTAEATEQLQDIYAEARAELEQSNGHTADEPAPPAREKYQAGA